MLFSTKYLKYSSSQNPLTKSMNNYSLPIDFTVLSSPHVHSLGAEQHCPSGAEIHLHCFPLLYRPLTPSSEMAHSQIGDRSLPHQRLLTLRLETAHSLIRDHITPVHQNFLWLPIKNTSPLHRPSFCFLV